MSKVKRYNELLEKRADIDREIEKEQLNIQLEVGSSFSHTIMCRLEKGNHLRFHTQFYERELFTIPQYQIPKLKEFIDNILDCQNGKPRTFLGRLKYLFD